jgi:FtsH-binding integral membrane protein
LLALGWISVVLTFFSSFLFGVIAIGLGYVLRKDYDARSQGLALIIFAVISIIIGLLAGPLLVSYISNH